MRRQQAAQTAELDVVPGRESLAAYDHAQASRPGDLRDDPRRVLLRPQVQGAVSERGACKPEVPPLQQQLLLRARRSEPGGSAHTSDRLASSP